MPTLIFVHGACVRDAAWWWSRMTPPLAQHDIPTVVVPLPSWGETGETLGDLADDVQACRQAIAEVDGPVVLCRQSVVPFTQPPRHIAWQQKPANVLRMHRGSCDSCRDAAPTCPTRRPPHRAPGRPSPISLTPGRVRAEHRCRDRLLRVNHRVTHRSSAPSSPFRPSRPAGRSRPRPEV